MTQEKELQSARYGFWGYLILIIGLAGITAFLLFINQDALFKYGLTYRQIWSVWGGVFGFLFLGSVCSPFYWRWKQRKKQLIYLPPDSSGAEAKTNPDVMTTIIDYTDLKQHLNLRYRVFWRRKVRLLLITGDEAAIEQLLPGLQQQQWLEGNRTVLIYGGSLASEPDREKYIALRKLRRGCPLDGIIRVLPQSLKLTPQISDNDLRGLEKISELLRYSAPVWLWQLCDSNWSQDTRPEQAVGASFPLRAKADDITRQLERMLPALRTQGVSQVTENNRHDFLLRLSQHLQDGGIVRWAQQLVPWLSVSQQRFPLRGLMFSLPEKKTAGTSASTADAEQYIPGSQRHALTLPATWQGIVDDCPRVRGRRVGMAWEQTLA